LTAVDRVVGQWLQQAENHLDDSLCGSISTVNGRNEHSTDDGAQHEVEEIMDVAVASLHLCADRARAEERAITTRQALPVALEEWSDNLVDMATGALLAPSRRHAHQAPT